MEKIEWAPKKCVICGRTFSYVAGGYEPKTCSDENCVKRYLHPELSRFKVAK